MKKILIGLGLITLIIAYVKIGAYLNLYTVKGEVIRVTDTGDQVTVDVRLDRVDNNYYGVYAFNGDGYQVGDKVACTFDSLDTETLLDDELIKAEIIE